MNIDKSAAAHAGLRLALGAAGLATAYVGVDNAFGGLATLGLQGPADFLAVTNEAAYALRDSHVRFLGGVWLGAGLALLGGALRPALFRSAVLFVGMLAFIGGLARLTSMGPFEMMANGLAIPLAAEILILPLLGWLAWTNGRREGTRAHDSRGRVLDVPAA
jgi:Domain of unknown function (DUF4345)